MTVLTIGRKLVPLAQVAFVEVFDPAANPDFKPEKEFKARLILLNYEIVLTEQTVEAFATEHGLHIFTEDTVAVNQAIVFRVEVFEPTADFKPAKPYKTRLKWRDLAGGEQSKLLLTDPQTVIEGILKTKVATRHAANVAQRPARGRKGSRRMEGFQS
ncbi:hypothetical protein A1D31_36555 [Bradyrhizobium liaoningense]|nr:hypothetical protein A1D31_36555 [Bradyrhizobium liaoningense]